MHLLPLLRFAALLVLARYSGTTSGRWLQPRSWADQLRALTMRREGRSGGGGSQCPGESYGSYVSHSNQTSPAFMVPKNVPLRHPAEGHLTDGFLLTSLPLGENGCVPEPGNQVPLHERGLCRWYYVVNYDEMGAKPFQRIPSTLIEARCTSCSRVPLDEVGGLVMECQPLSYRLRVLRYQEGCSQPVEAMEDIVVGCVPVPPVGFQF